MQIWNLSPKNLKILDKKDCIVELKAGYGDSLALILVGAVTDAVTTADGADRMTEIEVTDGRVALRDAKITLSINGKVNTKDIYNSNTDLYQLVAPHPTQFISGDFSQAFDPDCCCGCDPNGKIYIVLEV